MESGATLASAKSDSAAIPLWGILPLAAFTFTVYYLILLKHPQWFHTEVDDVELVERGQGHNTYQADMDATQGHEAPGDDHHHPGTQSSGGDFGRPDITRPPAAHCRSPKSDIASAREMNDSVRNAADPSHSTVSANSPNNNPPSVTPAQARYAVSAARLERAKAIAAPYERVPTLREQLDAAFFLEREARNREIRYV